MQYSSTVDPAALQHGGMGHADVPCFAPAQGEGRFTTNYTSCLLYHPCVKIANAEGENKQTKDTTITITTTTRKR